MSDAPLVLVADDDSDILELVALRIERSGMETIRARDGAEAIELLRGRRPDIGVLDVMMPKIDGLELTRRLRERPETAGMPILLLTARSLEEDVARGMAAGANDYLTKPFDARELQKRIRALVETGPDATSA